MEINEIEPYFDSNSEYINFYDKINKMKDFSVYQRKLLAKEYEEFNLGKHSKRICDDGFGI